MSTVYWRINSVAMIGAAIALASVFLPWWGIYELLGFDTVSLARWALRSPPGSAALRRLGRPDSLSTASISQTFTFSSLIVLILALVAASLALTGGLTLVRKYLAAGLVVSILTPVAYTITIAYVTSTYCLLFPLCASGPIGTGAVLRNHVHWGIRDWILHLHRRNSRLGPVPRLEQQPGQNHRDPSRRSLRPNQPANKVEPKSSFLDHWRVREDYSLLGYLVEISTGRYGVPTNP